MSERITDEDGWRWYADSYEAYQAGDCYISVTQVMNHIVADKMQSYMRKNSDNKQKKVLAHTSDIGTKIHKAIEDDLSGVTPDITFDIKPAYMQWSRLKVEKKIQAMHTEIQLVSRDLGAAGTADIIGWYEDKLAVMDVKTGFYSVKAGWQMAAYRHMAIEMGLVGNDCGMVGLNIKRDGSSAIGFTYAHHDWCLKSFVACMESFKALYFTKLDKMGWKFLHKNSMDSLYKNEIESQSYENSGENYITEKLVG